MPKIPKEKSAAALAREANLTAECLICSGAAAVHQHYGAVCCYSCRAFFRRGIKRFFTCVIGDNKCQVNSITRTNCKKCRFDRCLQVGMKPELVDATIKQKGKPTDGEDERGEEEDIGEVQAAAASILASPGSILPHHLHHHLHFSPANSNSFRSPPQLPSQPLPMYQLSGISPQPRIDSSILLQSLEERNRMVVEPRSQLEEHHQTPHTTSTSVTATYVESSRPGSSLGSNPVRQQTYYVFHPLSQTFEPVTIAEFLDQPAFEEVVEAETVLRADESDEEMQLHYIEAEVDEEEEEEETEDHIDQEMTIESPGSERRAGGHIQFDQENEDHRIIQEYLRIQQRSVLLTRSNSETSVCTAAEVVNSPKIRLPSGPSCERHRGPSATVSGGQFDSPSRPAIKTEGAHLSGEDSAGGCGDGVVDIEALVDLCVQEELANRRAKHHPPADPKPVLAVKPLVRNTHVDQQEAAGAFRSITKEVTNQLGDLEPGEVRPDDLPYIGPVLGEGGPGLSRLRSYRLPGSRAASSPELGEILDQRLEPGEIRPRRLEPGEVLGTGNCKFISYQRQQQLEPGEIPTETAEEEVQCFVEERQQQRTIFIQNSGREAAVSAVAVAPPGVQLHNIAIASPVSLPRKLLPAPPLAVSTPLVPPQRRFSVIQGPKRRVAPLPLKETAAALLPSPEEHLGSPAWSPPDQILGDSPVQAVTVIHHQHLPAAFSPAFSGEDQAHQDRETTDSNSARAEQDDAQDCRAKAGEVRNESSPCSKPVPQYNDEKSTALRVGQRLVNSGYGVGGKRRRLTNGEVVPLKKRRTVQGYPVSLGITRNKMLYLKFTLEEEFLLHQVLEARNHLGNRIFRQCIHQMPDEIVEYYQVASACSLTDQKIDLDMDVCVSWSEIMRDSVIKHGESLLSGLRSSNTSHSLIASLAQHSFQAYYAVFLAIFFGNRQTSNIINQEKFCGSTDEEAWRWCREQVPIIEAATSLRIEDFSFFKEEGTEILVDTFTRVGKITGSDEKLAALVSLLVLVSQPEGSPFEKSKHLKNLRNHAATIMYRYLSSKSGCDEGRAARLTYAFLGLLPDLHKCGQLLLDAPLWAKSRTSVLPALTSSPSSRSSSSPPGTSPHNNSSASLPGFSSPVGSSSLPPPPSFSSPQITELSS